GNDGASGIPSPTGVPASRPCDKLAKLANVPSGSHPRRSNFFTVSFHPRSNRSFTLGRGHHELAPHSLRGGRAGHGRGPLSSDRAGGGSSQSAANPHRGRGGKSQGGGRKHPVGANRAGRDTRGRSRHGPVAEPDQRHGHRHRDRSARLYRYQPPRR